MRKCKILTINNGFLLIMLGKRTDYIVEQMRLPPLVSAEEMQEDNQARHPTEEREAQ